MKYGYLICDHCDRNFSYSAVKYHNEAFEKGREFERGHKPAV